MSEAIISVESLSKSYMVGHEGPRERYHSLRDTIVRNAKSFARTTRDMLKGKQIIQGDSVEEFWALKDVSFEVKQGEVLGIIGRNGAGKSTLLKILSRITEPTSGRITLRGRVASLLEVGTGFHPELTGRENIFLNGAILGMTRAEIKTKFDEIVAFAEVEKFLDTPVKRYSSGMYVRLAFSVAAHLEPEILIVDEVLAVGDVEFQEKCMGKMENVSHEQGKTVIFVSHNIAAIKRLTNRAIILEKGRIQFEGDTINGCAKYLKLGSDSIGESAGHLGGGRDFIIKKVSLLPNGENEKGIQRSGEAIRVKIEIEKRTSATANIDIIIVDSTGNRVGVASTLGFQNTMLPEGCYTIDAEISGIWLVSGRYAIEIGVGLIGCSYDHHVKEALSFNVPFCNPGGNKWNLTDEYKYGPIALAFSRKIILYK